MFEAVRNMIGGAMEVAPPKDVKTFQMTDAEAAVKGRAYYFSAGKLTKCTAATGVPAVIALESADAATPGAKIRCAYVTPGTVYKVRPSVANEATIGDSDGKHANFLEGISTARFSANGDYVDWATDPASGCISVLEMELDDAGDSWLWVTFNKCFILSP